MAWRRPGDKPLSEPMLVFVPTHICVTRPQWVKCWYSRRVCVTWLTMLLKLGALLIHKALYCNATITKGLWLHWDIYTRFFFIVLSWYKQILMGFLYDSSACASFWNVLCVEPTLKTTLPILLVIPLVTDGLPSHRACNEELWYFLWC